MTQEQDDRILASRQYLFSAGNDYALGEFHRNKARMCLSALDHLTTRLSEVERERDEARALNTGFAMTLDEDRQDHEEEEQHLRAKIDQLEVEVARLTKERDDEAKDANAFSSLLDDMREHVTILRTRLAAMQAAVDEAVSELENLDETFDYAAFCRALDTLRNLTKPDTPSERIMSDKDRENPVEGAHPTQPEGEDALVEETYAKLKRAWLAADYAEAADFVDEDNEAKAILRKALASRGLVRGEGVER